MQLFMRIARSPAGPVAFVDIIRRAVVISLQYDRWLKKNELTQAKRTALQNQLGDWRYQPLISVLMPVYNTEERWLHRAITSVTDQIYPHWELCIADDASTDLHVTQVLDTYQKSDARIKVVRRERSGHIAEASNSALALATGDFIALLDHDDELTPDALLEVARLLNEHPEADFIYSDEDKLDTTGHRVEPFFKPDWSPLLLLNTNYITHLAVLRRHIVESVGAFRHDYVGSQDHDLFLRVTARTQQVFHIPKILYSWRKAATSAALNANNKDYAYDASLRAVQDMMSKADPSALVTYGTYRPFIRVRFPVLDNPLVSIVTIVHDETELSEARLMLASGAGVRADLVVVTNNRALQRARRSDETILVVDDHKPGLMLQAGAQSAKGDYLLFVRHPLRAANGDWLKSLLEYAQRPDVGCVGAKILDDRHFIREAGMVLGLQGSAKPVGTGLADVPQLIFYLNLKDAVREVSAVSAACLMTQSQKFWQVGGFDSGFGYTLYDADFCIRLKLRGLMTVYMPYASVWLTEANNRSAGEEETLFRQRWLGIIAKCDPYYNPHLTRQRADLSIAGDSI
jgi:glycosyltransferase involved in cell wall biosynthesis